MNLSKLAEQVYAVEQQIALLSLIYLVVTILLPVGVHTDFTVLCTRVDVLLSFFPVGMVD